MQSIAFHIYSIQEVATISGLKTKELWRAVRTGKLKTVRLDGKPYVTDRGLVEYLEYRATARYKQRKVALISGRRRLPAPMTIHKGNVAMGRLVLCG